MKRSIGQLERHFSNEVFGRGFQFDVIWEFEYGLFDQFHCAFIAGMMKWNHGGEHFKHKDTGTPDINLFGVAFSSYNFWSQVIESTAEGFAPGNRKYRTETKKDL